MSSRYFIRLSYNGSGYHGWQFQPNARSVQESLQEALSVILKEKVPVTGAGRTDTGVHAREYYAHFDFSRPLDTAECAQLTYNLNGYLPFGIAIGSVFPVREDAHARFSATLRTYQYVISRSKSPFLYPYSYYFSGKLDLHLMNEAAKLIMQNRDFSSFAKSPSDTKSTVCTIRKAIWHEERDLLIFTISADRFLRNMVRAIVGTLLEVGQGKRKLNELQDVFSKKDRSAAGFSVPAEGLFLTGILYPEEIFLEPNDRRDGSSGITRQTEEPTSGTDLFYLI
jgi:tRNA pseudouridine38-40 synthase